MERPSGSSAALRDHKALPVCSWCRKPIDRVVVVMDAYKVKRTVCPTCYTPIKGEEIAK